MLRGDNSAVRERKLLFLESLDGNVVAEFSALLAVVARCNFAYGDQLPITVACGNRDAVDRRGAVIDVPEIGRVKKTTGAADTIAVSNETIVSQPSSFEESAPPGSPKLRSHQRVSSASLSAPVPKPMLSALAV